MRIKRLHFPVCKRTHSGIGGCALEKEEGSIEEPLGRLIIFPRIEEVEAVFLAALCA